MTDLAVIREATRRNRVYPEILTALRELHTAVGEYLATDSLDTGPMDAANERAYAALQQAEATNA